MEKRLFIPAFTRTGHCKALATFNSSFNIIVPSTFGVFLLDFLTAVVTACLISSIFLKLFCFCVLFEDDITCYIHIVLMTDVGMRAKRCWQDTDISNKVL